MLLGLKPGLQACCSQPKLVCPDYSVRAFFSTLETEMHRTVTAAELLSYSKNILATKEASILKINVFFLACYGRDRSRRNGPDSFTRV